MVELLYHVFCNNTATPEFYPYCHSLSLHDALPIFVAGGAANVLGPTLAGALPWLAAGAVALPLLMGAFGRKPSVGPTGVARLPAVIGNSEIALTSDNGGTPEAAEAVARQIRDISTSAAETLGAFGSRNYGLDIGSFLQPEGGNSQPAGFNIREIIDRSEEHTSELQSLMRISYAVFCLKKK